MPRPLRPIAPDLVYHVMNRGNNLQQVFFDDGDYQAFLDALGDLRKRKPFELYAYCLRSNHFHLLSKPLEENIRTRKGVKDPKRCQGPIVSVPDTFSGPR